MSYFVACALLTVISKCHCIDFDYYDEKDLQSQTTENVSFFTSEYRRKDNGDFLINTSVQKGSVDRYSNFNKTRDEKVQTYSYGNDSYSKMFTATGIETSSASIDHSLYNLTILLSDIRKEYEYIYDDDKETMLLRHHVQHVEEDTESNHSESTTKVPIVEFYNLEPAIQQFKTHTISNHSEEYNIWYVSEDLPCWDLPLLYAEFGRRREISEVFIMTGGELKNVIEKNYTADWDSVKKPTNRPLTYYTRKWCTVEPCYGDHTLCLFSDETLSSLCGDNYRVAVPNILEQTALVNTLNSMRNKIANGESIRYRHLPTAANMKQILYDYDLEKIAKVWLYQCIPGPAPCSALDGNFVTHLECTKHAKYCCIKSYTSQSTKCTPKPECFLLPTIGCLHVWFYSAGIKLTTTDVQCGHTSVSTYSTAQLLWAATYKIGCAYAYKNNGDVRVICNFSPGAPFFLATQLFCGVLGQKDINTISNENNISDRHVMMSRGVKFDHQRNKKRKRNIDTLYKTESKDYVDSSKKYWGVDILPRIYKEGWVREQLKDYRNGTISMIARLVVKYEFIEQNGASCDSDEPIYIKGPPGSLCLEKGRRYQGLCYDFRDPTPGYRLVAIVAPIALFSLILYDLFSGVVRQTNY